MALDKPEMRCPLHSDDVASDRQRLVLAAKRGDHLQSGEWPVASKRSGKTEETIREGLVSAIVQILVQCELPASKYILGSLSPERILSRFGVGKRNSTLRGKIRTCRQMQKWLL